MSIGELLKEVVLEKYEYDAERIVEIKGVRDETKSIAEEVKKMVNSASAETNASLLNVINYAKIADAAKSEALSLLDKMTASQTQSSAEITSLKSAFGSNNAKKMDGVWGTFEAYGAAGDGVTDDTKAIQEALESSSYYIQLLEGKTYICSGTIITTGNKKIRGNKNASIKLKDNSEKHLFSVGPKANLDLENVILNGNKENQTLELDGVHYEDSVKSDDNPYPYAATGEIIKCEVRNFSGCGIYTGYERHLLYMHRSALVHNNIGYKFMSTDNFLVTNDVGDNVYGGICNGSSIVMLGTFYYRNSKVALQTTKDCYFIYMIGGSVDNNYDKGFYAEGYAAINYRHMFSGTTFYNNVSNALFENVEGGNFSGCSFFSWEGSSKPDYLIETSGLCKNINWIGNTIAEKAFTKAIATDVTALISFGKDLFNCPAPSAQFGGNITLNGTWDGGHLLMGTTHIWTDSEGNLRCKNGVPTGDTDGNLMVKQ